MSYQDAIDNLSQLIPELLSLPGQPRRKFSLDEIRVLSGALGSPQSRFASVLVAGTNGKGSTASTLASIGKASGLRVGLYTSPHLDRVNERIRLNGRDISEDDFARLYFRVHDVAQRLVLDGELPALPSYFELLTALAFLYFSEERVELAVLEVGMGGRLDATNLVDPIVSIITDISFDHQEWLGSTIDLIAREKAGILRRNGTLVTLPQHPEANQALGEVAALLNVRGVPATAYMPAAHASPTGAYSIEVPEINPRPGLRTDSSGSTVVVDSPLRGAHQHRNVALAIAAAVELGQNHHFPITPAAIAEGIRRTYWPGRLESLRVGDGPEFVLDVAHNPAGAWALRAALSARAFAESEGLLSKGEKHASGPEGPDELDGFVPGINPQPTLGAGVAGMDPRPTLEAGVGGTDTGSSSGARVSGMNGRPTLGVGVAGMDLGSSSRAGVAEVRQVLIFACLRDKPLREMTQILFPIFDHVVLAPIHSPRATEVADLIAAAQATGVPCTTATTVAEAIEIAQRLNRDLNQNSNLGRIVISGSLYLVGEARTLLVEQQAVANTIAEQASAGATEVTGR